MDEGNSNWNGIVEYTWDFGDATPLSKDPLLGIFMKIQEPILLP